MPLSATVVRGHTSVSGTPDSTADLNAGFLPSVTIEGAVGSSDIDAGAVNSTHIRPGPVAYALTTGSANAYVAAPSPALTALTTGSWLCLKANFTNTGPATLNVNGLGAVALRKQTDVALEAGDIRSGQIFWVQHDGTYWQLTSPAGLPNKIYGELAGAINVYTLTLAALAPAANSDFTGRVLVVKVGAALTNTSASTLNVNGLGAVAIKTPDGSDVSAGALTAGRFLTLTFDGTYWQLLIPTTFTLPDTGPGAGTYNYPASMTIDAKGRITAISAGTTPTLIPFAHVVLDATTATSTVSTVSSDGTADTIEVTSHGWSDGQLVWFDASTIGGTAAATPYYVENVDTDNISLHTTLAGAIANSGATRVNITSTGASVNTMRTWDSDPLLSSGNVDGVIRIATGIYKVDFTTDAADANYVVSALARETSASVTWCYESNTYAAAAGSHTTEVYVAGGGLAAPARLRLAFFAEP